MTQAEWLASTSPRGLLLEVRARGEADQRRLRLFACACCRRVWRQLDAASKPAIEAAEQLADGLLPAVSLAAAKRAIGNTTGGFCLRRAAWLAALGASDECQMLQARPMTHVDFNQPEIVAERAAQADVVRDLFGNPFHPVALAPHWLTPDVVKLAQAAYEERELPSGHLDGGRLAVLADALEEVGCDSPDIMAHLRGAGPHVRGCRPVDAILGKT